MTHSVPPPFDVPPGQLGAPGRRPALSPARKVIVAIAGGVALLCCGGLGVVTAIGTVTGDPAPPRRAAQTGPGAANPAPSVQSVASPSVAPSPSPAPVTPSPVAPSPVAASPVAVASAEAAQVTAPKLDRRYATCEKAMAAGLGPYLKGVDPEYAWYRDADNDGEACEENGRTWADDSGGSSGGGSSGGGSAYYANCTAARAAGAAPLHRGDPGYRAALDRDGDGVACE